ncbi:MAG TPA: patatin-like phospholipase family protein [Gemmatimonadales bacterium]|nr:patatin-like phospholipase family protein [Gemmatimonadales bacterium]
MTIEPDRVVLVLSGGGMKAMAQVGVLRALDEAGLKPAEVVSTSAGALVGALVASGLSYEEIVPRVFSVGRHEIAVLARWSVLARGLGAPSVLRPQPVRSLLERLLPVHTFAALRLPLRITAVDADAGELTVFGAGGRTDCTVVEAVMASMALPLYLPPVAIGGRRFVDGGLLEVLPLDVAAQIPADLVVAVDVGPVAAAPPAGTPLGPALLAAHDRAMAIVMARQRERAVADWKADARRPPLVLVEPEVDPHGTFAFGRTGEFIEAGYRAGHAALAGLGAGRAGAAGTPEHRAARGAGAR